MGYLCMQWIQPTQIRLLIIEVMCIIWTHQILRFLNFIFIQSIESSGFPIFSPRGYMTISYPSLHCLLGSDFVSKVMSSSLRFTSWMDSYQRSKSSSVWCAWSIACHIHSGISYIFKLILSSNCRSIIVKTWIKVLPPPESFQFNYHGAFAMALQ